MTDGSVNSLMSMHASEVLKLRRELLQRESDPSSKDPRKQSGAKTDNGKIMLGLLEDFPLALTAVADVATYGATGKYKRGSWRDVVESEKRCQDARIGHFLKARVEPYCPHTGLLHLAQGCWNALVELEAAIAANPALTAQYLERVATRKIEQVEGR